MLLCFGHGCSGERMLSARKCFYGSGMDALVSGCSRHKRYYGLGMDALVECSGDRMLSKHEHYYGLGMDALVTVCSRNTNVIMLWAWMLQ